MRYRVIEERIKEDPDLWNTGESLYALSKRIGVPISLLSLLKRGKRVVKYETYLKYRKKILGF